MQSASFSPIADLRLSSAPPVLQRYRFAPSLLSFRTLAMGVGIRIRLPYRPAMKSLGKQPDALRLEGLRSSLLCTSPRQADRTKRAGFAPRNVGTEVIHDAHGS